MFEMINRTDRFHLYYLLVNNIQEEKYSGLSHVAEHACLLQDVAAMPLWGQGYTYFNHVCLHFCSSTLEILLEIDKRILAGKSFTSQNVHLAKRQVIQEINRLQQHAQKSKQLIGFVTDKRIGKFPLGEIEDIKKINEEDIMEWFASIKENGNIFRFIFRNAHEMILSTPIQPYVTSYPVNSQMDVLGVNIGESFWPTPSVRPTTISLYCKIPALQSKQHIVLKAFVEYCIERELNNSLGRNVTMLDQYFDTDERFWVFQIPLDDEPIECILKSFHSTLDQISSINFELYKDSFLEWATSIIDRNTSNCDVINAIKNWILYRTPSVEIEDVDYIKSLGHNPLIKGKRVDVPLKIVIR